MVKTITQKKFLSMLCLICIFCFACKITPHSFNNQNPDQKKPFMSLIKMNFINIATNKPINFKYIQKATLIRYSKEPQEQGVTIKRWAGDTSGKYKYLEQNKRVLTLADYVEGNILLKTGIYQIKHNSISGQPPSGYYGKNHFFEIKVEETLPEIKILLSSAI